MKTLLLIQVAGFAFMLIAALSHKWGLLNFKPAFLGFILCACVVVVLFFVGVIVFVRGQFSGTAQSNVPLILLAIGALPLLLFFFMVGISGLKVPKIHDISTRFDPPILFMKAQDLRRESDNSLSAASQSVIDQQIAHYSELRFLQLSEPLSSCFEKAKTVAESLGWNLIAESEDERWIEAYDETTLFGFKDDVRIELSELDAGCRVDVRSVSRVGMSDMGVNAKRIERFFHAMNL